ncbi:conserved protein of unknown function [Bradyrhizobium vignae]|uniref:Uncharacterized protein n=1 Tax=Bradyrhizobium vignae TaxID=1549949 RepID=A0A2U3PU71_9BRAD|nr:conserved protein of unknown function [Bradyrhizobium vignae]
MDAFDRFWQWAEKPLDSPLTIPAELHRAVMELSPEDRRDRARSTNPQRGRFPADRLQAIAQSKHARSRRIIRH